MHDAPADDYQWPTCTACGHDLWTDETTRWACRPCEQRTRQRLSELPTLWAGLNTLTAITPRTLRSKSTPGDASRPGSRTAPVPARLDALQLAAAGGVATRLEAIEDSWRQAFGRCINPVTDGLRIFPPWRASPHQAVPEHVNFLRINLERACEQYESVGQDIEEIRRLHSEMSSALATRRRPGRVKIGLCPVVVSDDRCGTQLTAAADKAVVRCPGCGTTWDGDAEWRALRRAQEDAAADGRKAA